MFKKLKKKIEEESSTGGLGSPGGGRDLENHGGPGLASPMRLDQPPGSNPYKKDFDTVSMSSETSEPREATSKEEVLRLLMKRTDQVRKLEGKITDLAALIKEKNRSIDNLENSLEKQSIEKEKQIQELNEQFSAKRARMKESSSSDKKEEALRKELEDLRKQNSELLERASVANNYRERMYKQEEENEENMGLATQETAKIKHMLLITQEDLLKVRAELKERNQQYTASSEKVHQLEGEVTSLMQQIGTVTTTNEDLESSSMKIQAALDDMKSLKQGVERQLQGVQKQHSAKAKELTSTQQQLQEVLEKHQEMCTTAETEKQKMSSLLAEKDEQIGRLEERVQTLDQRVQDGELSGDDRVRALEAERASMEQKLSESREQLSQLKSSTSEKISQLEQQVSSLQSKVDEDQTELQQTSELIQQLQQDYNDQMDEIRGRLEEAHRKAKSNWDQLADKERQMEKQRIGFENELLKAREQGSDMESELKVKVSSLESEVKALEKARQQDRDAASQNMQKLRNSHEDWLEKEIDAENRISTLEGEIHKLKGQLSDKEKEMGRISQQRGDKDRQMTEVREKLKNLEAESKSQKIIMEQHKADMLRATRECQAACKEKDDLMLGNATLSSELERLRQRHNESERDHEREVRQRETAIAGLERAVEELTADLTAAQNEVKDLSSQHMAAINEVESAEINKLRTEISSLETQLGDRNKTIKMQQQRLSDLKKTLQREFKVQALPNDEPHLLLPPSGAAGHHHHPGSLSKSSSTPQGLNALPDNYVHKPMFRNSKESPGGAVALQHGGDMSAVAAALHLDNAMMAAAAGHRAGGNHKTNNHHVMEYNRDINFEYLRHVVLKFMLSRETEALHLIKAVSVLLDFTHEEQQLLKDTLEYKMSWFGFKSPSATRGGQMAKTIPPSY